MTLLTEVLVHSSQIKTLSLLAIVALAACTTVDRVTAPAENGAARESRAITFNHRTANLVATVPSPAGLRACFAAEGNAFDIVSNNSGSLTGGATYTLETEGKFGRAFRFTANGDGVTVPASSSLDVGVGAGLTMAAWVSAAGTVFQPPPPNIQIHGSGPIVEYDHGAQMWHHSQQHSDDALFANIAEGNFPSGYHIVTAQHGLPQDAMWHHAAVTYDKATGNITLYIDGEPKITEFVGSFTPNTTETLRIGRRAFEFIGGDQFTFNGLIDEVQIYERALSETEVATVAAATGTMCVAPPVSFDVTQLPSGGESGAPFAVQPIVVLLDASNQVVSNATTPVTATITAGTGTLIGTTTINASAGVAQFTDLGILGGSNTVLSFSAGSLPVEPGSGGASSPPITAPQVPRQLLITTQPTGGLSGALLGQPVVAVRDAGGLAIAGNTSPVTASIASGIGTLSGTTTVNAVNGVATFTNLVVSGGGPITLVFSSSVPTITPTTSDPFSITVVTSALAVAPPGDPTGVISGVAFAGPAIEVVNSLGERVLTATGTITASLLSGPAGTTLDPSVTTATIVPGTGVATFAGLKINGPGPVTLGFSLGSLAVAQATFPVAQTVNSLAITASPATISTAAVMTPAFSVQAKDAAGVPVAGAVVTAALASGYGSGGTLAGTSATTNAAGIATFTGMTVTGPGPVKFSFSVAGEPAAPVVSNEYTVVQIGPPAALQLIVPPSSVGGVESGVAFGTQPSVRIVDASGALVTSLNSGTVSVSLSGPSGTSLGGTLTAPVVGGVATFTNLKVNGGGTVTLHFAYLALPSVASNPITVVQQVRQLAIVAGPGTSILSLATITPAFAVELRDAAGIKVASSTLPVTMTLSSGVGTLTGTAQRAAVAGVATFPGMSTDAVGPVKFRFTLVNPAGTPPLPTVETGVITSLYTTGTGFYLKPIDNLPIINVIEGGSKVPVKFTIGGNRGLGILATGSPSSRPASCVNFAPTGPATPIDTKDALSYNGNHYQITWQTSKEWDGTCRILIVTLKDGSEHPAHFIIK